jgi:N6-L-threonylcarbamoyladenine synthase
MQYSTILGIESSCDDTAVSVYTKGKILANVVAGQQVHEQYGGVVPELASRAHQSNIVPVTYAACKKAGVSLSDISAIAYTRGPGLMGSLHVGGNFAKGLSLGLNIPIIGVNHLQAHVAALYIDNPTPKFPILCLLVSGGHTQLLLVSDYMKMEIVGQTMDDAAGEAFDKAAKLLGLPYPGGPLIDKLASHGNKNRFAFPEGKVPGLNYSFSGVKTNLLYFLKDQSSQNPRFIEDNLQDICASYQNTIVNALIKKTEMAINQYKPASLGLAGGVSANSALRMAIADVAKNHQITSVIPAFEYCTDNAAMIAIAGHFLLEAGEQTPINALPFTRQG